MIKVILVTILLILVHVQANATLRVIDGDTIKIDDMSIRLQGVDAPEIRQECYNKKGDKGWDCGRSAKAFVEGLVAVREVDCNIEEKADKYGRSIGICFSDGIEINKEIIRAGYGLAYSKYSKLYVEDESFAKLNNKGIWSGKFKNPEDFRRTKISK